MKSWNLKTPRALCIGLLIPLHVSAVGSWQPLANVAPEGIGHMSLLSDGTVMAQGGTGVGTNWFRLTPDTNGSYVNGTWTELAPMHDTRKYYSSDMLQDGRLFVAGGEYGTGNSKTEVYDPVANTWTPVPVPDGLLLTNKTVNPNYNGFSDSLSVLLSNGEVLITPVWLVTAGTTALFDPVSNTISIGPSVPYNNKGADEQSAVKLSDDSILTFDRNQRGERYIPSLNQWITDQITPVNVTASNGELGAGYLLPDGRAFFLGGTGLTLYYTPTGDTNWGTWTQGPTIPDGLVAQDAPSAMMVNGKILCAFTIAADHSTNYYYEFTPGSGTNGTFAQTSGPNSPLTDTNYKISDGTSMLDLPDGTVLYSDTTKQVFDYQPDTAPLASGKPVINNVAYNADRSLHITGKQFNGISQGAAFGDDNQMDSNYPLVRFTGASGNVTYGRTYNWSNTGVQTGGRIVTTECALPANLFNGPGTNSLQVVANGIASDPVTFHNPVWVNFNYLGATQNGNQATPYKTLAQGTNAVSPGGVVAIDASVQPSSSHETMKITKRMTIISVNGRSMIGN